MQKIVLSAIFLWLVASKGTAQQFQKIDRPSFFLPLVVMVTEAKDAQLMQQSIDNLPESLRNQHHFLLLFGERMDTSWISYTINKQLNDPANTHFDKQKIYVYVLAVRPEIENYLSERSIFAGTGSLRKPSADLATVLENFKKQYLWKLDIQKIEQANTVTSHKNRRMGFGILLGFMNQKTIDYDSLYVPNRVIRYGILANYRLSKKIELLGKFTTSLRIPNKSKLQSEIFNQIDVAAGGEQAVSLEIKYHIFMQASIQGNYLFKPLGKFQPFAGAGLAMVFFRAGKQKIEETIDVSSITGGGGPPGDLGIDPAEGGLPGKSHKFLDPYANIGFSYRIATKTAFTAHLDYHFLNRSGVVNGVQIPDNFTKFYPTLGLQFSFGKTSRKYNYLNAHSKKNIRA